LVVVVPKNEDVVVVDEGGPLETTRLTVVPCGSWVPADGLVLIT
jgi:hypothetical protein